MVSACMGVGVDVRKGPKAETQRHGWCLRTCVTSVLGPGDPNSAKITGGLRGTETVRHLPLGTVAWSMD